MTNKARATSTLNSGGTTPLNGSKLKTKEAFSGTGVPGEILHVEKHVQQATYDLNYLKRLLYLKAALDQEQTGEVFQVPITPSEFNLATRQTRAL
jgi:hypothetical protein